LAALGEVRVPEEAGGDGAIRPPGLAESFEALGRRALPEVLHFLDGSGEREVAGGPNVGAAKRREKIDVGGPAANAFEGDEHFAGGIVVKIVEVAKIEKAAGERFGEKARVQSFLAAEADAKELGVGEFQEAFGSEGIYGGFQAFESGFCGSQRNLLLEDDVDERGKARLADPERRTAVLLQNIR